MLLQMQAFAFPLRIFGDEEVDHFFHLGRGFLDPLELVEELPNHSIVVLFGVVLAKALLYLLANDLRLARSLVRPLVRG